MALSGDLSDLALLACDLAAIDCSIMGLPWTGGLLLSTLWIVYRVYLVFHKPIDDLEEVLGIDVPPVPDLSLSSTTSDTILLYWKPPEHYHTKLTQYIQINGITISEFENSNGSVQLTGLRSGLLYGIRAISTNEAGNSTYSKLIQVQTAPKERKDGIKRVSNTETNVKRTVSGSGRRVSHPIPIFDQAVIPSAHERTPSHEIDSEEIIAQLTRKLESLRQQKEEAETQLSQEADEFEKQKQSSTVERDNLKRVVEEKERTSQELKKQVNELEKRAKVTQRNRGKEENALQQRNADRQRMRDDIEKWIKDSTTMQKKTDALNEQKVEIKQIHAQEIEQAREHILAAHREVRELEEEFREWAMKIRDLEAGKKKAKNADEVEAEAQERDAESLQAQKLQDLQDEYKELYYKHEDAKHQVNQQTEQLNWIVEYSKREPGKFAAIPGLDFPTVYAAQRRNRQSANRLSTSTYGSNTYSPPSTFAAAPGVSTSAQPPHFAAFASSSRVGTGFSSLSPQEIDSLTAGAPMSPTANSLLPKDLLGDDDFQNSPTGMGDFQANDPLGVQPPPSDYQNSQDPQSPASAHSASPSVLSSPRGSFANVASYAGDADRRSLGSTGSPYTQSLTATTGTGADSRRQGFFHWGRQRPKSSLSDLPQLGSLKSSQSQSFPSNDQDSDEQSSARWKSGVWSSPTANLLSRGASTGIDNDSIPRRTRRFLFGQKLDPLEAMDSLDRSASPRPASTYSHENSLPRPSSDSQPFGWGAQDTLRQRNSPLGSTWGSVHGNVSRNASRRQSVQHGSTSNLSLGSLQVDPDDFGQSGFAPPKPPPPAPIGTERFKISREKEKKEREKDKLKPMKQLNPAAPTFKTLLFSKKTPKPEADDSEASTSKTKSKSKNKDKDKPVPSSATKESMDASKPLPSHPQTPLASRPSDADLTTTTTSSSHSLSHSSPRMSRDGRSISTAGDDYDPLSTSRNSLEPSTSAAAYSDSNAPASSSTPSSTKESLMQRITRKSSSSKFSTAWKERSGIFARDKKGREGKDGGGEQPSTPGDVDEEGGDYLAVAGGAAGSEAGTPGERDKEKEKSGRSSLSWTRVMNKKGKAPRKSGELERELEEGRGEE